MVGRNIDIRKLKYQISKLKTSIFFSLYRFPIEDKNQTKDLGRLLKIQMHSENAFQQTVNEACGGKLIRTIGEKEVTMRTWNALTSDLKSGWKMFKQWLKKHINANNFKIGYMFMMGGMFKLLTTLHVILAMLMFAVWLIALKWSELDKLFKQKKKSKFLLQKIETVNPKQVYVFWAGHILSIGFIEGTVATGIVTIGWILGHMVMKKVFRTQYMRIVMIVLGTIFIIGGSLFVIASTREIWFSIGLYMMWFVFGVLVGLMFEYVFQLTKTSTTHKT